MAGKHAEAIAEGVAIALAAARLALKNHILVDTISGDAAFEGTHFRPAAQEILGTLATEAESDAARLKKAGRQAWGKFSQSDGTHDYRDRDVKNLRKRRKQSEGVAEYLRELAADPDRIDALVEESREAAWGDVAENLDRQLRAASNRPDADPNYEIMREARMQALALVDLQELATQVRARKRLSG